MRYLSLILFFLVSLSCTAAESPSVVVIGGGPVGLAAALEACASGAQVTVIEKREIRTRRQRVFLSEASIQRIEHWRVTLPAEYVFGDRGSERIAVVPIHELEELFEQHARRRGVTLLSAEFDALEPWHQIRVVDSNGAHTIRYDLLIAADGTHSTVREAAGIPLEMIGHAEGALAWLKLGSPDGAFAISDPIETRSGFLRRIQSGGATIIFSQGPVQGKQELLEATERQGWDTEAELIREGEGMVAGEIPLSLQRALSFSDRDRSLIILGDAAAAGSFFQGLGLNTGLRCVSAAGDLIRQLHKGDENAYSEFEAEVKDATDFLIEDNRFLFEQAVSKAI